MLNGQRIPYNSDTAVNIRDIGTGNNALMCVTDRTTCCSGAGRAGEWYYPDGSRVNIQGAGEDFFRNRGSRLLRLNKARNTLAPTGRYRCEVPDASGVTQNIFINVVGKEHKSDKITSGMNVSSLHILSKCDVIIDKAHGVF